MRISTVQILQQGISNILSSQSKLAQIQNQIASGKRIDNAADDPIGASQITVLNQEIARTEQFQTNSLRAENQLSRQETILDNATNVLQRVRELHIQAGNDVLNDADRQAIVEELNARLNELVELANSQDSNGHFVFSGFQSLTRPFNQDNSGSYVYGGDQGERQLEVASGLSVITNESGASVFEQITTGNGFFTVRDPGATNTGTAVAGAGTLSDQSSYIEDDYTISFVTNANGELAYQVVGATSGQVIPALPAAIPNDAPAYVDGQDISFNGISIAVSGEPAVGDDFILEPSAKQSIFNTIAGVISSLEQSTALPSQKAQLHNSLNQSLSNLDNAIDVITATRTRIGARLNTIDTARNLNEDFLLTSRQTLSSIEDLDLSEAAINLNAQATALQAAQQSFARIQSLNLFNFI